VLTVSARNIPTAFLLSYKVQLSVEYQGRELLAPETHTVTREFSFDESAVLAKIAVLVFIIVFIQKRPQGLFALKGRAVEA